MREAETALFFAEKAPGRVAKRIRTGYSILMYFIPE
jgi:hypothetical protein